MEDEIKALMAKEFGVSISEIDGNASPHSIPTWNSLTHINLILALQKRFNVRFEDEEIPSMISFKMIVDTIRVYQE